MSDHLRRLPPSLLEPYDHGGLDALAHRMAEATDRGDAAAAWHILAQIDEDAAHIIDLEEPLPLLARRFAAAYRRMLQPPAVLRERKREFLARTAPRA